jgi:hypothetical protein
MSEKAEAQADEFEIAANETIEELPIILRLSARKFMSKKSMDAFKGLIEDVYLAGQAGTVITRSDIKAHVNRLMGRE